MSRRKQQKPRHLDTEEELNGVLENGPAEDVVAPEVGAEMTNIPAEDGPQGEFLGGEEEMIDAQKEGPDPRVMEGEADPALALERDELRREPEESVVPLGVEAMGAEGQGEFPHVSPHHSHSPPQFDGEEDTTELDDGLDEDEDGILDDEDLDEDIESSGQTTPLPKIPGLGPMGPILPDSNVKIESLENTKVAVAQFAENNIANPQDLAFLQTTLYNLQQQQLFQLQLLQTLHQQLMSGMTPSLANMPQLAQMPTLPFPGMAGLMRMPGPVPPAPDGKVPPEGVKIPPSQPSLASSIPTDGSAKMAPLSNHHQPRSHSEGLSSDISASEGKSGESSAAGVASSASGSSGSAPSSSSSARDATTPERTRYAIDDPFFKHKCRYCHKVFGSDSALQIHIRSHTGERPYKCNICGNRFSTKGNLKVHFQRHKAKYPHIKMNPNPVPEHLDRLERPHPPMLVPAVPRIQEEPLRAPPLERPMHNSQHAIDSEKTPTPKSDARHLTVNQGMKMEPLATNTSPKTPTAAEAPPRSSPNPRESASTSSMGHSPSSVSSSLSSRPVTSVTAPMIVSSMGLSSPIPGFPHMSMAGPPIPVPGSMGSPPTPLPPFGMDPGFMPRPSILPSKLEDPLEQYMEVQKSETSKLEALVKNIETKLTDPNQCAICHRILSCKSALQMHYRTHTGERPFKCKICGRAFTTKGNLKTHMGVHRAKPPIRMMHQCPVCHKQFTNALVLQQHIRMHTGELPKDVPFPNPEMMMGQPGGLNFMPFPGFQFYPPGMPQPPQPFAGELDLRKPSPGGSHSAGEKRKLDEEDDRVKKMKTEMEEGMKSESNLSDDEAAGEMDDEGGEEGEEGSQAMPAEEGSLHSPLPEGVSTTGSDRSTPHHKTESESKSPFSASMPTPPTLVPVRDNPPSPSKPEYYSESGNGGNYPPSSYSTSLMALEERVKAIDSMSYASSRPLEQMENIIRRADPNASPGLQKNGEMSRHSPSMPNLVQGAEGRREGGTPRSSSPTPSEGNLSHNSFDSSRMSDSGSENPLLVSPGGLHMKSFGALDLSPNAFEAATGKPNTTCNICYKTFACRSALDIHYRSHTKERPFKCEVCDRAFSTKGNMKQHMLTHKIRDLPSQAFNAGQSQGSPSPGAPPPKSESGSSGGHGATEPSPRPPAATPVTSSESGHGGGVVSQSSSSTTSSSASPFVRRPNLKHVCQVCQKPFSSASALQIHMRTHTGDKPFKCTVCGKAFTTKGNLKVHMGTHMWNNGPSRRGRRMSVEGIPALPPKEAEYLNHFAHRGPSDMYPFPFPGFPNAFPPKLNEISVIQSLNGNLNHLPPSSMAESMLGHPGFPEGLGKMPSLESKVPKPPKEESPKGENNNYPPSGNSGELDLSVKRSPSRRSPSPPSRSPEQGQGWMYSTCHLCNKTLPSMAALENHMKSHLSHKSEESSPKTLVA